MKGDKGREKDGAKKGTNLRVGGDSGSQVGSLVLGRPVPRSTSEHDAQRSRHRRPPPCTLAQHRRRSAPSEGERPRSGVLTEVRRVFGCVRAVGEGRREGGFERG